MADVVYLTENNRHLTITGDVKIYNNRANYGGAVSLAGGTVQISGGEISDNQAYRLWRWCLCMDIPIL